MSSPQPYSDNSSALFSKAEQHELNMFLDGFEGDSTNVSSTTALTPILLSSPFQAGKPLSFNRGGIQINPLLIPSTKHRKPSVSHTKPYVKKQQPKKRAINDPLSSTSSAASSPSSEDTSRTGTIQKKTNRKIKKATQELLSEDQKRANHIASEQKRRANIRVGFDKLVDIVPTLSTGHRSEAFILQKSVEHLRELIDCKTYLKEKARQLQLLLGEIPDEDSSEGEMDYDF